MKNQKNEEKDQKKLSIDQIVERKRRKKEKIIGKTRKKRPG